VVGANRGQGIAVLSALGFGILTASILALAAVGFTVQFSVTNILNLAYGDVMTGAAFIAYVAASGGLGGWWGLAVGGLFGAVFSLALNRLVYTPFIRRGASLFTMIIVTIAVSLILQNLIQAIWGPGFFSLHIPAGPSMHALGTVLTESQLAVVALAVASMIALHVMLRFTRLGKAMRATAADPELARNCGIQTRRVTDIAWLISGLFCGLAGVTLVVDFGSFQSTTGGAFLVPIVAAAVLGGVGHPYGAMLGALVIGIVSELSATVIDPAYKDVTAFVVLIAVLLIRPQGIISEIATTKAVAA
jgi:branched-subunit amino acid ABC-type transport system permease component